MTTSLIRRFVDVNKRTSRWVDGWLAPRLRIDGNQDYLHEFVWRYLRPRQTVGDVGGGKQPFLSVERKADLACRVIGIDISSEELARAPSGAYDEVIVGDITHSRVARSDIDTLVPLGATVTLSGPPTLVPAAWRCGMAPRGTSYEPDLDRALDGADGVIALRLQKERQHAGLLPSIREYAKTWGLSEERVKRMRPEAPVLHPGPMNEGVEIAASVAHGARSLIETQVTNGVAVRMALLYLLAGTPEQTA